MISEQLKELLHTYFEAGKIPVCLFTEQNLTLRFGHLLPDYNLPMLLYASLCASQPEPDFTLPDVWYSFTPEFIYFGGLRLPDTKQMIFIGPLLISECSVKQADTICQRLGRKRSDFTMIQRYFSATGPHSVQSLMANLHLFGRLLQQTVTAPIPLLPFEWSLPYPSRYQTPVITGDENQDTVERLLLSCVRTGNLNKLNYFLNLYIHTQESAFALDTTTMRSYILGANLLASRTAYTAGIDYQLINTLSGKYIDLILQARTATDLSQLFFRCFQEYTTLVAKLHELPSDSPIVRFVHQYITTHYNEKVTPSILANKLHMNVSYLCTHFKKETGMTVSTYIQEEKIREARRLLEGSGEDITAISSALAFSSQSYFCAVFKKVTGITPDAYRHSLNG